MGTKADRSGGLMGQGKENMDESPQRRGRLKTKAKGAEMRGIQCSCIKALLVLRSFA